ncbi:MAG: hypothetical protein ACRC51_08870 [Cetobacterium sp.]
MKLSVEKENLEIDFGSLNEKEVLSLYEVLGKDICKKFGYDYLKLLKIMIKREESLK